LLSHLSERFYRQLKGLYSDSGASTCPANLMPGSLRTTTCNYTVFELVVM
jgi:hypothetical protein